LPFSLLPSELGDEGFSWEKVGDEGRLVDMVSLTSIDFLGT
jgi:hypothetical protein